MRWKAKQVLCVCLFSLSLHASASEPGLKPVTLQLKWKHQFNFAGYYAAKEKGYFEEAGFNVTIKEGLPGVNFIDEVVQGRADYGIEMPDLIIARANGEPVVVLAAIFQHSPYVLLATKASGIRTPQDAVGKTIMMRQDSAAELRSMLINEGVSLESVTIVPHTWNLDDLIDGKVDAVGAYISDQPFVLEKKGVPYTIIKPRTYGIDFYGDCLFTSEAKLQTNPEEAKAFRAACIKGWEYAMAHPDELIQIIKDRYKSEYSVESMRHEYEVLKKEIMLPELVEVGHMNPGRWKHISGVYNQLGMLPREVSLDAFLYDPEDGPERHWLQEKWVRNSLIVIGLSFLALSIISFILYFFNQRLHAEVKRQTEQIRRKEEQFRAVFDNHFQLTGLLDIDGRVKMVNHAALELQGLSEDDVLGKYLWETGWWAHSKELQEKLQAALDDAVQGNFIRFDATHPDSNGDLRYIDFSIKPIKDNEGKVVGLVPEGRDVTERNVSQQRYEALFEQSGDAIIIVRDGVTVDCNVKTLELFECGRDWIVGSTFFELAGELQEGSSDKSLADHIDETTKTGMTQFECEFKTANSNHFIGEVSLKKITLGSKDYLQAIVRDISEQKDLEAKLQQAQKMEAIGTLAGGIAHDFNNILAGMMGFNDLALRQTDDNPKLKGYLTEMLKSIDRAKELVEQILTFSRHSDQAKRPVMFAKVATEAFQLLRATFPATISLNLELKSDAWVHADPTQLHQIIMNLCTNAFQAMGSKRGQLTVRLTDTVVEVDDSPGHHLAAGAYIKLEVEDNGCGISPDKLQKIFEPYFTTKEKGKGTGLGLAVVHGIVVSHHGDISVSSQLDKGTTFTILLPTVEKPQAHEAAEQEALPREGNGEHVLFVDDEEIITTISNEMLKLFGYKVSVFNAPDEAFEAFKNAPESYDIVITDMTMPGMTGLELTKKVRELCQDIPVIICSGYSEDETRESVLQAGVDEYLLKPVPARKMAMALSKAFGSRK